MIDAACRYYEDRQMAIIEKTPEPMRPIKSLGGGKFVAHYEKQAQPDYKGTLANGRAIVFEAKHTSADKIEQSRLTEEQCERLQKYSELGAIAFILVSVDLQNFYRVPWTVWRDMKEIYGHKHMTIEELEPFKIKATGGIIRFLEGGRKMITKETRRESYEAIIPKITDRKSLILEIMKDRAMTAHEITEELLAKRYIKYYDRNFVSPRLTELKEDGMVEVVGKKFCSRTRRRVSVWKAIEEVRDWRRPRQRGPPDMKTYMNRIDREHHMFILIAWDYLNTWLGKTSCLSPQERKRVKTATTHLLGPVTA